MGKGGFRFCWGSLRLNILAIDLLDVARQTYSEAVSDCTGRGDSCALGSPDLRTRPSCSISAPDAKLELGLNCFSQSLSTSWRTCIG